MSEKGASAEIHYLGEHKEWDYGQEYIQARAGEVIDTCLRFGLNGEFVPMLAQYLTDLHLIIGEKNIPQNAIELRMLPKGVAQEWSRCVVIDEGELKLRIAMLNDILRLPIQAGKDNDANEDERQVTPLFRRLLIEDDEEETPEDQGRGQQPAFPIEEEVQRTREAKINAQKLILTAIDWAFYEQAMVVLSNVYHMRNRFGVYLKDLNDQSPYYRAQYSISATFLAQSEHGPETPTVSEDLEALTQGFGLMLLHGSLIKHGLVRVAKQADWVLEELRHLYPAAYRSEEIAAHLERLKPVENVLEGYRQFSEAYFDEEVKLESQEDTTPLE